MSHEICGTGQRAMRLAHAEREVARALRSHARGRHDESRVALEAVVAETGGELDTPRPIVLMAYARTLFALGDAARARAFRESAESALVALDAELAKEIATYRLHAEHSAMWLSRALVRHALARELLGDAESAVVAYREAISVLGRLWGEEHLELAGYLDGLANVLLEGGDHEAGNAAVLRARAIVVGAGFTYRTE